MKYSLLIILYTFLFSYCSYGQFRDFELSTSVGLGLVEGHPGFTVEGEFGLYLEPKISVGVYFNLMNSQKEMSALGPRHIFSVDSELFILPESETLNIHRAQNSLGIQGKYFLLNKFNFDLFIGGGVNYNVYKSLRYYGNALNESYQSVTYSKFHDHGVGYHGFTDLIYQINQSIGFGLKIRFMYFKDYNFAFMLNTKVKLFQDE